MTMLWLLDFLLCPVGALATGILFAAKGPRSRTAWGVATGYFVWLNIVGRLVLFSASMRVLYTLGVGIDHTLLPGIPSDTKITLLGNLAAAILVVALPCGLWWRFAKHRVPR
jgi:hypothetical protein